MKESRLKYMQEVQQWISDEYKKLNAIYRQLNPLCAQQFEDIIFPALKRRLSKISVRSSFVIFFYWFLHNSSNSKYSLMGDNDPAGNRINQTPPVIIKVAFIIDAVMSVIYMHNHSYDLKFGLENGMHGKNIGAFNILKEAIYKYIQDEIPEYSNLIINKLRKAYSDVDHGQLIDQYYNFDAFHKDISSCNSLSSYIDDKLLLVRDLIGKLKEQYPKHQSLIDIYFARLYLISSSLFVAFAEILVEITNVKDQSITNKTIAYAELYGLLMQVVNDNADFALDADTSNKKSYDVLSDLRNQTITMPVIILKSMCKKENLVTQYIDKISSSPSLNNSFDLEGKHNEVLKVMVSSKALIKSVVLGTQLKERCIKLLANSPHSEKLIDATNIADYNRYYFHIFKSKKYYKKGKQYRCEDYLSSRETSHSKQPEASLS